MNEISKKELRRIWVIYLLLGGAKYQQDIIIDLNWIADGINERDIEYHESELIQEYDPNQFEIPYSYYFENDEELKEDNELFWELFWENKTYKIDFDDLEYSFALGKEGDVSGIEMLLSEMEGLEPDEIDKLDLDDWPHEIVNLVELRKSYLDKFKRITDPMVSTTLKELRDKGIIESIASKREGRGPSPNKHYLKQDINTLSKVISELSNPKLGVFHYSDFKAYLMSSKYVKNLINMDVVTNLEKNLKLTFTDEEKDIILNIVKISPTALSKVLEYSKKKFFVGPLMLGMKERNEKKFLLFNLQVLLGEDIERMPFVNSNVEYKITVSFKNGFDEEKEGKLWQKTEKNNILSSLYPLCKNKEYKWIHTSTYNSPL